MISPLRSAATVGVAVAFLLPAAPAALATGAAGASGPLVSCAATLSAPTRDAAFSEAAKAAGVPESLLKAVSYMESRWDDHQGRPSGDGGYGVFGLSAETPEAWDGSGKGRTAEARSQIETAAALAGLSVDTLKQDPNANICGGAALLASYHDGGAGLAGWRGAVARFGGEKDFVEQVYQTLKKGETSVTEEGERVTLDADASVAVPSDSTAATPGLDCPADLGCESLPAPYAKDKPTEPNNTVNYGNHDIADRTGPGGPKLQYIVIHDTEGYYGPSVRLAQDPTYLAWNYTIRSSDGHIAQHLEAKDLGWHAGNWYVNMHSIGIEHEGFAGTATWFTESMYQTSAKLVKHLSAKYGIPLDRAHIIGHDQVPGTVLGNTKSVHWDPGPYWDWEHYFELLGAPIGGTQQTTADVAAGDVVEVRTGYGDNPQTVTGCAAASPNSPDCVPGAGTNFVPLHQSPSAGAPLAKDPGWKPTGVNGTTYASDISARVTSGQKLVVAQVQGDWLGVWWAGSLAWLHNPATAPVVVRTTAKTVTVKSTTTPANIYGRAYPEASAYAGTGIPVQALSALEYKIPVGQTYAVSDDAPVTDYYRAVSFDGSAPGDRTDVVGQDKYYQLWYAHRQVFVRAAEVDMHASQKLAIANTAVPAISSVAKVGEELTASPGTWSRQPAGFDYQWYVDGAAVDGATGTTYRPVRADLGKSVTVKVTVDDPYFADASATSEPTAPVAPGTIASVEAPAVTGIAKVGWWLKASPGTWAPEPESVSYQWLRDGVPVPGATGTTYHLKGHDLGARISVRVTVSATAYDDASGTSQPTAEVAPAPPSADDAE
ncbi:N-acetylmuramoyl-L-alanine amidase [Sphaerisporangium perillae]|uniref:N-acetylmuramoyl-L-alanine amidase n=1 Tax=Sphaerisporangium perillae TaxID=2935860 RepID=UPI00200DE093|nr:N-acetylmuramoyl-L-alanine amidase [Sphaerisporangium perillae]